MRDDQMGVLSPPWIAVTVINARKQLQAVMLTRPTVSRPRPRPRPGNTRPRPRPEVFKAKAKAKARQYKAKAKAKASHFKG